jgi:CRP-like cAMP-binding protein
MPAQPDAEKVVDLLGPGKSFGAAIMFLEGRYPVSAQAVSDSAVLLIPSRVLLPAIDRNPLLSRRMLAGLSMKLHGLIRDVEAYSVQSAMQRVLGFLGALAMSADAGPGPVQVRLPASKRVIASRLNLTPETFSRLLHKLTEQDIIEVQGRVLIIRDPSKLESAD